MTENEAIHKIREDLGKAKEALGSSEINMSNYGDEEVSNLNQASIVAWMSICDALVAIDSLAKEMKEMEAER